MDFDGTNLNIEFLTELLATGFRKLKAENIDYFCEKKRNLVKNKILRKNEIFVKEKKFCQKNEIL